MIIQITQYLFRSGLWLLLFFLGMAGLAQETTQKRIDSVLETLDGKPYEETKDAFRFIDRIISKDRSNAEALLKYTLKKDSSDLANMMLLQRMAQRLSQQGKTQEALELKLLGLQKAEKLQDEGMIMEYHVSAGNAYLYMNQPDKALYHLNEAEKTALKPEHRSFIWNVYYNKGLLQNMLGNVEDQTEYYRKMYEETKGFENSSTKRFSMYILVDHFSQIDAPVELAKYTEELATLYEDAHPNTPAGHMPILNIFEKRAHPSNLPRLKESIAISDSLNSINSYAYNTIALANTYSNMKQPGLAVPFLERAIAKLRTVEKPQVLLDLLVKATQIHEEANNYKKAYAAKVEEARIRDSVTSERMQQNIATLEVKFDTERKERQIAEQQVTIERNNKQQNFILITAVALGLLLLTSLIFFRKRLNYQRTIAAQRASIQDQEINQLRQKNKLLALNSMIEGQEAERLRIAKDLHDSLGGLLSTVKAHFTTIQKEIEQLEKLNITEKTNELIDEACLEVRRISHNMMPHALSISGLEGAIEDLSHGLTAHGIAVNLEIQELKKLDSTKEVMIYRLLQELLTNITRHSGATEVLVQILQRDQQLHLTIEDNGRGFDYQQALDQGGIGLKSVNSRVEFLDGSIHWDSREKRGTIININIPVS